MSVGGAAVSFGNSVWVAGVTAQVFPNGLNSIKFKIPPGIPGGPQTVSLQNASLTVSTTIGVLGDVKPNTVIAIFKPGVQASDVINKLALHGFTLKAFHPLTAPLLTPPALKPQPENACSGALGEIDVNGKPLGQALEELEGDDIVRNADPQSAWGIVAADHLEAIGAPIAHRNLFRGRRRFLFGERSETTLRELRSSGALLGKGVGRPRKSWRVGWVHCGRTPPNSATSTPPDCCVAP